jgi:hypothetical protein
MQMESFKEQEENKEVDVSKSSIRSEGFFARLSNSFISSKKV